MTCSTRDLEEERYHNERERTLRIRPRRADAAGKAHPEPHRPEESFGCVPAVDVAGVVAVWQHRSLPRA
jgi:hypothetical protein